MATHKHILWIYSDELRADSLSCYGGPAGLTPNLDKLAAQGTRFTQAWCSSPVCVPSRTSAVTALPATQTGVYHNECAWPSCDLQNTPRTWIQDFNDAGYRSVNVGKIHLPQAIKSFGEHYNENGDMPGIMRNIDHDELKIITPPGAGGSVGGRWPKGKPFPPEDVTKKCVNIIKNPGNKPLLLRASYLQPHTPVTPPEELIEAWSHLDVDTKHHLVHGPSQFEKVMEHNIQGHAMDMEKAKFCWIAYHALVHWLDIQVGQLLDALDEAGLADDTLVLFTADHGASLGEKGLWAKQCFSRGSHQVPLIVRQPGQQAGQVDDTLTNGIDLGHTFAAYAGVAPQPHWQGRNILNPDKSKAPDSIFSIIGHGLPWSRQFPNGNSGPWTDNQGWPRRACIRTHEWRYERNVRMNGEPLELDHPKADPCLIHLSSDPMELTNVAKDHPDMVAKLDAELQAHLKDAIEQPVKQR